jgi:hypothetical protein
MTWRCGNCDKEVACKCCPCCGYDETDSKRIELLLDRRIERLAKSLIVEACGVAVGYLKSRDAFACREVGRALELIEEKFTR